MAFINKITVRFNNERENNQFNKLVAFFISLMKNPRVLVGNSVRYILFKITIPFYNRLQVIYKLSYRTFES